MSYGLKYYGTFKNYFDETITVNIYARDYSGDSEEVFFLEGSECIVNYPGDDTNIYNPIFGSQAKVTMISETDFQFIDLHTSDVRGYRLDVLKSGVLDWRGWIIPDLFSEPYVAPPYPVTITARCGLGELKEREIPEVMHKLLTSEDFTISSEDFINGFVNLYTIIGNGLLDIGTELPLNDCINVHHDSGVTANDSPIYDTYINIVSYEGLTYYEAISDILKTFGARLYQQGGEWWIVRLKEYTDTLSARKWDVQRTMIFFDETGYNFQFDNSFVLSETKLTTFLVGKPTFDIAAKTGGLITESSPQLEILPAWKKFNIIRKATIKETILKNSYFDEWEGIYEGGSSSPVDFKIKEWNESEEGFLDKGFSEDGSKYALFPAQPYLLSDREYIWQTVKKTEISLQQRIKIKIVFKAIISPIYKVIVPAELFMQVRTRSAAFYYYLKINDDNELEWTTDSSNTIRIAEIPVETLNNPTSFETAELTAPGLWSEPEIRIKIYGSYKRILCVKEITCKVLDRNEVEYDSNLNNTVTINEDNIYTPDDIELIGGDIPDISNNNHIWENFYADKNGDPTKWWGEDRIPLMDVLKNSYRDIFFNPQFKLSLAIISPLINFDSSIVDYQILPKKYICNSAEINYRTNIFNGTFIEFAAWEGAPWILEDGTWDDQGIWKDSETWNDSDPTP